MPHRSFVPQASLLPTPCYRGRASFQLYYVWFFVLPVCRGMRASSHVLPICSCMPHLSCAPHTCCLYHATGGRCLSSPMVFCAVCPCMLMSSMRHLWLLPVARSGCRRLSGPVIHCLLCCLVMHACVPHASLLHIPRYRMRTYFWLCIDTLSVYVHACLMCAPLPPLLIARYRGRMSFSSSVTYRFLCCLSVHQWFISCMPQGADVFLALYNIHRSPDFWENPDEFDPDRFTRPFKNPGVEGWAGFNPALMEGQLYPNEVRIDASGHYYKDERPYANCLVPQAITRC